MVIMEKADYEEAVLGMLKDENFYIEKEEDLNGSFEKDVELKINEFRADGYISYKEADYLLENKPETPKFYALPKIHKGFDPFPPLRPIVSGCNSCCERISNFVDFHLKKVAQKNDSYVKDTTDFVRKIQDVELNEGSIVVSADVTGLYTVIDHQEGADACREALETRPESEKQRLPSFVISDLVLMILKSNCFVFLGRFFHQIVGTAMGTPMAPSYANIYMGRIEKEILAEYERKTGLRPTVWLRFLDDIFMVWPHGSEKLQDFIEFMQQFGESKNMRTNLKFTFETGSSVPFLDTMVSIDGRRLKTTLFSKPTDAHLYLRSDSCHPPSCTKGLVKGELLRARRICTKDSDFKEAASRMKGYFIQRGFNQEAVEEKIAEVLETPRNEALTYRKKEVQNRVPCVLTYHPRLKAMGKILHKHFKLLQSNERLKRAFPEAPMVAFKRLQNLRDVLVHTGVRKQPEGVKRCSDKRCKCCNHLQESTEFEVNGRKHKVTKGGSCDTENVIYGLRCKQCNIWYIGESSLRLRSRLNGHRAATVRLLEGKALNSQMNDTGAAEHFSNTDGHDFDRDMEVSLLESGNWRTALERKKRESYYICKYATLEPAGMNKAAGVLGSFYGNI